MGIFSRGRAPQSLHLNGPWQAVRLAEESFVISESKVGRCGRAVRARAVLIPAAVSVVTRTNRRWLRADVDMTRIQSDFSPGKIVTFRDWLCHDFPPRALHAFGGSEHPHAYNRDPTVYWEGRREDARDHPRRRRPVRTMFGVDGRETAECVVERRTFSSGEDSSKVALRARAPPPPMVRPPLPHRIVPHPHQCDTENELVSDCT